MPTGHTADPSRHIVLSMQFLPLHRKYKENIAEKWQLRLPTLNSAEPESTEEQIYLQI